MSTDETYENYTNRETWAVALHINNDQGWQESVYDALREQASSAGWSTDSFDRSLAGEIIRENVEGWLFETDALVEDGTPWPPEVLRDQRNVVRDIGSLWRVNWTELGATFLADLTEQDRV